MEIHYKIAGIVLMLLGAFHIVFPKYFNWKEELQSLSVINREMMWAHTFFIGLIVFLIGLLCFTSAKDLVGTELGKRISLGLGIFWVIRLFIQFFGYSSTLWKGKAFETSIHIVFSFLWTYLSVIFLRVYFI